MKVHTLISSAMLALLVGFIVWILQPEYRAFTWVQSLDAEYLAGYLPGDFPINPDATPELTVADYSEAIESLYASVSGEYFAHAGIGGLGRRIRLADGTDYPPGAVSWVSDDFFAARGYTVAAGSLFDASQPEGVVMGHELAREMFRDPADAVGQQIELLGALGVEKYTITGVLGPSPAQDPRVDVDNHLIGHIESQLQSSQEYFSRLQPLFFSIEFSDVSQIDGILPQIRAWVAEYFGEGGNVLGREELFSEGSQADLSETRADIATRQGTLLVFGLLVLVSAAGTLVAQLQFHLIRRRQLLGVDKALGASRRGMVLQLLGSQFGWTVLGGVMGAALLPVLHVTLPDLLLTPPPFIAFVTALVLPLIILLALVALASLPLLGQSAMSLLRGRIRGNRIRSILWLVYGGLALAIAGGLASMQVYLQVEQEADHLQNQFGSMYTLQTGTAVLDTRLDRHTESGGLTTPSLSGSDTASVGELPGVIDATLAQSIVGLGIRSQGGAAEFRAMAADSNYMPFMGLNLLRGDSSGCVLSESAAQNLNVEIGSDLQLQGITRPVPCTVSGIMEQPSELWNWLVLDLPQVITPPLDGIGLALPGYTAEPFRSIRILLQLESAGAEQSVHDWLAANRPDLSAEVIPYTPEVSELLESLRVQAQLFLLISALAGILGLWGIVAGFMTLLEADRFRLALDRAFGLTVRKMALDSWQQLLGLGAVAIVVGAGLGWLIAVHLYNAFALDIQGLPRRELLGLNPLLLTVLVLSILILSSVLTLFAARWLRKQSSMTLLKEGAL